MIARIALALLVVSFSYNLVLMAGKLHWSMIPAALVAWIIVDFFSGFGHMILDYYPAPARLQLDKLYFARERDTAEYAALRKRLLRAAGPFHAVAYDFKVHHPHPDSLGRRDIFKLTETMVPAVALPLSLSLNALSFMRDLSPWFVAFMNTLIFGYALTQYFHSMLHQDHPPLWIRAMRKVGLLMTPSDHAIHHATLDRDFAVITGWTNPLINPMFRYLHRKGVLRDEGLEPPCTSV